MPLSQCDGSACDRNVSVENEPDTFAVMELKLSAVKSRKKKRTIIKNLVCLSLAFVCLMASLAGLAPLQSSINKEVGLMGLSINYGAAVLSCLFVSIFLVRRLGCKWTIIGSMCCFVTWFSANLFPVWGTMVPASLMMGIGFAPLWTAHCTYFTICGVEYAKLTNEMPDLVIAKFFSFYFMAQMTGPLLGNSLSSSILRSTSDVSSRNMTSLFNEEIDEPFHFSENSTVTEFDSVCGANHCPFTASICFNVSNETMADNFQPPSQHLVLTLVGTYVALGTIAVIIVGLFVDNVHKEDEDQPKFSLDMLMQTFVHMKQKHQLMLIPITMYAGMQQAFIGAEYTRAFVTCVIGLDMVGFAVICTTGMGAISSIVAAQCVKVTGRIPIILVGCISQTTCLVVLRIWKPQPDVLFPYFLLAAAWGIGDATIQAQLNAFYGSIFPDDSEAAFSNYRLWESLGQIIIYTSSSYICMGDKIYIVFCLIVLGFIFYVVVEISWFHEVRRKQEEDALKGKVRFLTLPETPTAFQSLANLTRRKSSVFVPRKCLEEAEALVRRKSSLLLADYPISPYVRRRLSLFAPIASIKKMPSSSSIEEREMRPIRTAPAAVSLLDLEQSDGADFDDRSSSDKKVSFY